MKVRRRIKYPSSIATVYIPDLIWEETLTTFRRYSNTSSEGLVYWGGIIGATQELFVTSLLKPNHIPQGGRVKLTDKEAATLVRTLFNRDEKLIAQIHSHGGQAFHSHGDDLYATSFHEGFFSIVVPYFGVGINKISECAVYEYRGGFQELSQQEITERFKLYMLIEDMAPRLDDKEVKRLPWWIKLIKKLKFIVYKKQ